MSIFVAFITKKKVFYRRNKLRFTHLFDILGTEFQELITELILIDFDCYGISFLTGNLIFSPKSSQTKG